MVTTYMLQQTKNEIFKNCLIQYFFIALVEIKRAAVNRSHNLN